MDVVNRLAPPAVGQFVRRLSANSEDIQATLHPPDNEYFQQIYHHQHPDVADTNSQQQNLLGGLRDRLSPAGAAIGQVIRKLSHTEADIRTTLPQNEYLQQIHAAAIAEQNRMEEEEKQHQEAMHPQKHASLNIVSGITSKIGTAVRRLSTYEDDPSNKLSSRDAFRFFQLDENAEKSSKLTGGRRGAVAVPDALGDGIAAFKKKKKNKWKELIAKNKAKNLSQVKNASS